jgi:hypothetical protein
MSERSADEVQEIPIEREVNFRSTIIGVERTPENRVLTIICPMSGTKYNLPMDMESAGKLATDLVGGLQIAQEMPGGADGSARDN